MNQEFSFNGQRDGEKVVEVAKNHAFVLLWPGLKAIFFALLGIATILNFQSQFSGVVLVIMVLIAIGIFGRAFYDYSQSMFLITNQRVMNVEQRGFFSRKITETDHEKIQDVSSQTKGLFKMMLKFGDLVIRTAGSSKGEEIIIKNIPNPYEYQQVIAKMR